MVSPVALVLAAAAASISFTSAVPVAGSEGYNNHPTAAALGFTSAKLGAYNHDATRNAANMTHLPPSRRNHPDSVGKHYTLNVLIGSQAQHVGSWGGDFMYDEILEFLYDHCAEGETGSSTCDNEVKSWKGIEYSNDRGQVDTFNEYIEMYVESEYFPFDYGKGIQVAMYELVADAFRIATADGKNCYDFDRKSTVCLFCSDSDWLCAPIRRLDATEPDRRGRVIRWCNAPEFVRVSVADAFGEEVAHIQVNLQFTGKYDEGRFECNGVKDVVDENARNHHQPKLEEETLQPFHTVVMCASDEVTGSCPNEKCLYELGSCF